MTIIRLNFKIASNPGSAIYYLCVCGLFVEPLPVYGLTPVEFS